MTQPTHQLYLRLVFAEALAHDDPVLGTAFPIGGKAAESLVIGRSPDAHDSLLLDFDIWSSRANTRLACFQVGDQHGLVVSDLNSRNGTWVDGRRISQRTPVSAGQVLRIGSTVFVVGERMCDAAGVALDPPTNLPDALPAYCEATISMFNRLQACPPGNQTLFLSAETGTNGQAIARWWHRSRRGDSPFVVKHVGPRKLDSPTATAMFFGDGDHPGWLRQVQSGSLCIEDFQALPEDFARQLIEDAGRRTEDAGPQLIALWASDAGGFPTGMDTALPEHIVYARVPPIRERRQEILPLFIEALGEARSVIAGRPCLPNVELAEAMLTGMWTFNMDGIESLAKRFIDGEALTPDEIRLHSDLGGESARATRAPGELAASIREAKQSRRHLTTADETLDRSV